MASEERCTKLRPLAGSAAPLPHHAYDYGLWPNMYEVIVVRMRIQSRHASIPTDRRIRPDEMIDYYAADPVTVKNLREYAERYGITTEMLGNTRTMELNGSLRDFSAAFNIIFRIFNIHGRNYRAYYGPLWVPIEIGNTITDIQGLHSISTVSP